MHNKDEQEAMHKAAANFIPERTKNAQQQAQAWYEAFRDLAWQSPLPMIVQHPRWRDLPDWYRDLLTASMELYLERQKG